MKEKNALVFVQYCTEIWALIGFSRFKRLPKIRPAWRGMACKQKRDNIHQNL